jgi:hypothetical protein
MNDFLGVGYLSGRKNPCMYVKRGVEIRILATFKSEEAMREFLSYNPKYNEFIEDSARVP